MKKPALIAVLLMSAAASGWVQAAQWTKVGGAKGEVFYIDKSSVVKKDKTRKVWSMHSYAKAQTTPEGKPYRSVKAQHLYYCDERTMVMLSQVFYPEAMGKGEPVENYIYEKFSPEDVVPGSPFEKALSKVCKR
ncbi:MAG TPA: surface-adhesin E family protein [Duganella sp.]|nr:surface-adhesin E family protein [Duganella sp.]